MDTEPTSEVDLNQTMDFNPEVIIKIDIDTENSSKVDLNLTEDFNPEENKNKDSDRKLTIEPDKDWMTKNTADLNALLASVPREVLETTMEEEQPTENMFDINAKQIKKEILENKEVNKTELANLFNCGECDFKTNSRRSIRMHNNKAHESNLVSCKDCQMKFKTIEFLIYHEERKHKKFTCEKCDHTANSARHLKLHKEKEHKKNLRQAFKCKKCSYVGKSLILLKAHGSSKHTILIKCDFCEYNGPSLKDVRLHKQKAHINDNTPPVGCKRDFSFVKANREENEVLYVSEMPDTKSPPSKLAKPSEKSMDDSPKDDLTDEKEMEEVEDNSKCNFCGITMEENKGSNCGICDIGLKVLPALNLKVDLNCGICKSTFKSTEALIDHKATKHSKVQVFCEALIKYNSQLKVQVSELKIENETLKAFNPQDDRKNEDEVRKDDLNHLEKKTRRKEQPAKKKQIETDGKESGEEQIKEFRFSEILTCERCDGVFKDSNKLQDHINKEHEVEEMETSTPCKDFTCEECDFQGNTGSELQKHIVLANRITPGHRPNRNLNKEDLGVLLKCRGCEQLYCNKQDLMDHRKKHHRDIVRKCRNYLNGNCPYSDVECWFSHGTGNYPVSDEEKNFECRSCGETFESLHVMMKHRKEEHARMVPQCKSIMQGTMCEYKDKCWYGHLARSASANATTEEKDIEIETPRLDFRKRQVMEEPPDQTILIRAMKTEIQNMLKEEIKLLMKIEIQSLTRDLKEMKNMLNLKQN